MLPRGIRPVVAVKYSIEELALADVSHADGWIGFDLDGTLVKAIDPYQDGMIGEPITEMVERVKQYLDKGITCKIFTARVATDEGRNANLPVINIFSTANFGKELEVTNEKDPGMVRLYDDRAIQVAKNTGKLVGGAE